MAARTTLNAKNLEALGSPRLAELILELVEGDAAAKRRASRAFRGGRAERDSEIHQQAIGCDKGSQVRAER